MEVVAALHGDLARYIAVGAHGVHRQQCPHDAQGRYQCREHGQLVGLVVDALFADTDLVLGNHRVEDVQAVQPLLVGFSPRSFLPPMMMWHP
mgnify:CR=1 FL=1